MRWCKLLPLAIRPINASRSGKLHNSKHAASADISQKTLLLS